MAFSKEILFDTTPELAANSAISLRRTKAAGQARPNFSWLSGTNRLAPVPVLGLIVIIFGFVVLLPFLAVPSLCLSQCKTAAGGEVAWIAVSLNRLILRKVF